MYPFWGTIGWVAAYIYIVSHIQEKYLKRKVHIILEVAIIIALIGARTLWVIVNMFIEKRFFTFNDFVNGGLVYYGGMLPVVILIYLIFPWIDIGKSMLTT